MGGRIFVLDAAGRLAPLEETPYQLEDVLQGLLADHPDLLAGDQVDETSPRRWLLVQREAGVPDDVVGSARWAADHLFLDQDGVPTLVEVKRSSDTRLRREVIGQMLDYAANAVVYWPPDAIRLHFEARCEARGQDPDLALGEFLGDDDDGDVERFWERVTTNLQAERIRMILVADEMPREVRRIIEFLNGQMDPAEVLGVQIRHYVGAGVRALVPQVIGQTAEAQQKKSSRRLTRAWDEESFDRELTRMRGTEEASLALRIRKWAAERAMPIDWGTGAQTGSFQPRVLHEGEHYKTFGVNTNGEVQVGFGWIARRSPFDDPAMRTELASRLNVIPGGAG